ncbi:MAG TPA: hypothetical protein VE713_00245 [Pyrinomonadaceae bacterium]|nr:hypothetical protein [Pyrinomonadaceae bacterium]
MFPLSILSTRRDSSSFTRCGSSSAQHGSSSSAPRDSFSSARRDRPFRLSNLKRFLFASSLVLLAFAAPLAAQTTSQVAMTRQQTQAEQTKAEQPQAEVERLRGEVRDLREEVERLRALVESKAESKQPAATQPSSEAAQGQSSESARQASESARRAASSETGGAPQSTGAPESPRVALATKAQGGDLAGAGNLLRTDRITIGGYGDAQFRGEGVNEKTEGGARPTFAMPRVVVGLAAVLSEKHNIVFNSELEYEFAGGEVEVEQAFVEWKARPEFAFRGGVFVPALGRFNVYHDSNLNLTTIRPLLNQFVVPTAYSDAGLGIRGRFRLPRKMKLSYELDVVNGMRAGVEEGEGGEAGAAPFSRLAGQAGAAEIHGLAFEDNNRDKAVVARVGLSPFKGFEFGLSGYRGRVTDDDDPRVTATMFFFDASYRRGGLVINGEYGRSRLTGAGIPRRSPAPPVFNPADAESADALADFLAAPTPGQDGFYVEGAYQFRPRFVVRHFDEGGFIAPVFRFEGVRLDRTLEDFYLNRRRATVGLSVAPSSGVIFKLNYLFNRTASPVPRLPAALEEEFGLRLLPFRGYGRDGFAGSVTYVF